MISTLVWWYVLIGIGSSFDRIPTLARGGWKDAAEWYLFGRKIVAWPKALYDEFKK